MKTLGAAGERLVEQRYKDQGYKLLERNYIFPHGKQIGELDLIFHKDRELVFVEVKTRSNNSYGGPLEAVDKSKQRKLVHTAKLYLQLHAKYQDYNYRIDVAAVDIDNTDNPVIILENAIEDLD
ncbi:MAG: YraN family protein [Candidatus Doudnabacteria bacterium]|nr:YraN family protein [Candidatus Doudnabacteria bacterium]